MQRHGKYRCWVLVIVTLLCVAGAHAEEPMVRKATQAIIRGLTDPDVETQRAALRALGHVPNAHSPEFIGDVSDFLARERFESLWAAEQAASMREAARAVLDWLNEPTEAALPDAYHTLEQFGPGNTLVFDDEPDPIADQYDDMFAALFAGLRAPNAEARAAAARALGNFGRREGTAEIAAMLSQRLQDESIVVRIGAATSLGSMGPEAEVTIPVLLDSIDNASAAEEFYHYATSLQWIAPEDPRAIQRLLAAIRDESRAAQATDALIKIVPFSPQADLTVLATWLDDKEPAIRFRAASLLAELAQPDLGSNLEPLVPALAKALDSDDPVVCGLMVETLGQLGLSQEAPFPSEEAESPMRRFAVPALERLLKTKGRQEPLLGLFIAEALMRIQPNHDVATALFVERLHVGEDGEWKAIAVPMAQQLIAGLGHDNPRLVQALEGEEDIRFDPGVGPPPPALALLPPGLDAEQLIRNFRRAEDPGMRLRALETLEQARFELEIEDGQLVRLSREALNDPDARVRARSLKLLGWLIQPVDEPTEREIAQRLQDVAPSVREQALRVLGQVSNQPSAHVIQTLRALEAGGEAALESPKVAIPLLARAAARGDQASYRALFPLLETASKQDLETYFGFGWHHDEERTGLIELLKADLHSEDKQRRLLATRALGGMGVSATSALPGLFENLADASAEVRRESIQAIGVIACHVVDSVHGEPVHGEPTMPTFPWQPAYYTHADILDHAWLGTNQTPLNVAYERLRRAIQRLGYRCKTYIVEDDHVVLMTAIERIDENGVPNHLHRYDDRRTPPTGWSLLEIARRFFFVPVGQFRMFVIVLTDQNLRSDGQSIPLTATKVDDLIQHGHISLPLDWGPLGNRRCYVLVYRYQKEEGGPMRLIGFGREQLNWSDHMKASGLWGTLEQNPR